jgi:hypothetical protein
MHHYHEQYHHQLVRQKKKILREIKEKIKYLDELIHLKQQELNSNFYHLMKEQDQVILVLYQYQTNQFLLPK